MFIDASGFLMGPYVRRTWERKGSTPVLDQCGRSHRKVSAIAALCVPSGRNPVRCYFRLHPGADIEASRVFSFLRLEAAPRLIWDGGSSTDNGGAEFLSIRRQSGSSFLPRTPPTQSGGVRLDHLKTNPSTNDPHREVGTLSAATRPHARSLQSREGLFRSFLNHSPPRGTRRPSQPVRPPRSGSLPQLPYRRTGPLRVVETGTRQRVS